MKGKTNNPNGRPKGVPNKVTKTMREFISEVIDKNRRQIVRDLKALEPKERLIIIEKLLQYVLPKQQSVKAEFSKESLSFTELLMQTSVEDSNEDD
ncbi:MAG: hypothetical protein ACI308_11540 [Muribaculaceae bacterium]